MTTGQRPAPGGFEVGLLESGQAIDVAGVTLALGSLLSGGVLIAGW